MPLPRSCCSACKKYRPSVHRCASSAITSSDPADPVNPEKNARVLKYAPTYSEPWKSSVTIRQASTLELSIFRRSAAIRSVTVMSITLSLCQVYHCPT